MLKQLFLPWKQPFKKQQYLDTGFIFALTDKTDDNHSRVLRVAQIIGNENLVLLSVVIPNLSS